MTFVITNGRVTDPCSFSFSKGGRLNASREISWTTFALKLKDTTAAEVTANGIASHPFDFAQGRLLRTERARMGHPLLGGVRQESWRGEPAGRGFRPFQPYLPRKVTTPRSRKIGETWGTPTIPSGTAVGLPASRVSRAWLGVTTQWRFGL